MNYERLEMIGRGGMSEVYRGRHRTFGHMVALKYLKQQFCDEKDTLERFLREAKVCHHFNHPHIVRVEDLGRDESGRPFIVMELLEGETLRARLQHGPLPENEARRIATQILNALEEAHADGVVHRDMVVYQNWC
jgi:serine/threonine-protein kinase